MMSTMTWTSGRLPRTALLAAALTAASGPFAEAAVFREPAAASQRTSATFSRSQEASLEDLSRRAGAAREAGRLEQAVELYRQALARQPDWDEGRWYLATVLYELESFAEARDLFAALVERQPAHAGALGMKGLCEFQLGRHEQALADLLNARELGVARSPGIEAVVRYHTAILLNRFGDFEVANQLLTGFAVRGEESPQIVEAFGLNVLRMPVLPSQVTGTMRERVTLAGRAGYALAGRHTQEAKGALDDLIARFPGTPHSHYARGVLLLTGDADRALDEFRRELAISPNHVPARLQMAFEYLKRGEPAAARGPAEEAVRLAPDHFATRAALGQVKLASDDVRGAIDELEAAAELAPASPQVRFLLARAYARAGRDTDAERERAEFVRLDQLNRSATQGERAVGGIPGAGADSVRTKEGPSRQ